MKKISIYLLPVFGVIAAAAFVSHLFNKKRYNEKDECIVSNNKDKVNKPNKEMSMEEERQQAANSIAERHKTAAQVIKECLKEEYDLNNSQHKVDFDEIDNSLDILMEEE